MDVPVAKGVPPQLPVYHFHIPDVPVLPPEKPSVDIIPEQIWDGFDVIVVGEIAP